MVIKSELSSGRKIYIEGDRFEVISKTDRRKSTGYYEYLLKPLSDEILESKIHYKNSLKVIFEIVRKVDCQIRGRSFKYKGEVFQISKQYDKVYYDKETDSMVRDNYYELTKLNEKMFDNLGPRRFVVTHDKKKLFYDYREITMEDLSFLDNSTESLEGRKETLVFKYTFREPVG